MNEPIIHALIPARGGSKSIPRKNIKIYKKHPLIAYTILVAKNTPSINRIVVSTDCKEIQGIAKKYGADAPFLRPCSISGDHSPDIDCFRQYINWLKFSKQTLPDIIVHLRPTYPERDSMLIQKCITKFIQIKNNFNSLRTVVPIEKSVFKMYLLENNTLIPTYKSFKKINEPYNQVRQILPTTYLHNGCIDIMTRETIENGSMTGDKIYAYVMPKEQIYDIDTPEDWIKSETSTPADSSKDESSGYDSSEEEFVEKKLRQPSITIPPLKSTPPIDIPKLIAKQNSQLQYQPEQ